MTERRQLQADDPTKGVDADAAVNRPNKPSPTIHHLIESAMEVAQGHYDSANKLFQVTSSETERPELKRLAETLGLMCVKVEGREYQLELMLEELKRKKEELEIQMSLREESGFLFTVATTILCLYIAILYWLVQAEALTDMAKSSMMLGVIATILGCSLIYIKRWHRPWRDWGFTLAGWAPSLRLMAMTGLPLAAAGVLWKWLLTGQADSAHFGRPVFEAVDPLWIGYYLPIAVIQEVTARGIVQTVIGRVLTGRYAAVMAVIVTSLVFAIMHLYYSPVTVAVTLVASLYFGWLYHRHKTLVGVSVAHYLLGYFYIFVLRLIAW